MPKKRTRLPKTTKRKLPNKSAVILRPDSQAIKNRTVSAVLFFYRANVPHPNHRFQPISTRPEFFPDSVPSETTIPRPTGFIISEKFIYFAVNNPFPDLPAVVRADPPDFKSCLMSASRKTLIYIRAVIRRFSNPVFYMLLK